MLKMPKIITKTLSARLSLMVTGAVAVLLLVSMAVVFHFSRMALKREALEMAAETLDGTHQHIDNVLLSVEQTTGNIYYDLVLHLNDKERMFSYSRQAVACNPYIVGCAIAFEPHYFAGHDLFMAYARRQDYADDNSEIIMLPSFGHRPYTEQAWYAQPVKTGRPCWLPMKGEDEPIVTFSLPFYYQNSDKVGGVIAVDVSLSALTRILEAVKPSPNGYAMLLGRDGTFISHPDTTKLFYQTVFTQTKNGANPSVREFAEAMLAGETGYKSFQLNGSNNYVFYKPFRRSAVPGRTMERLGWSIGIVEPKDDVFGEYNLLHYYVLGIAIVGILLFFVLCSMVIHRQVRPLRLLTHSVQRIAAGHYDETIPYTRRNDEIGKLQEHFQKMQQSLAHYVSQLEELTNTLHERGHVLRNAYRRAQEADRMKTAFLHHMTNQMQEPAAVISQSVATLCDTQQPISRQEACQVVEAIQQQSKVITDLLGQMLDTAENDTGKEASDD